MFMGQLAYNLRLNSASSRVLFLSFGFGTFVLFAHFDAFLTTNMTVGPEEPDITSFKACILVLKHESRILRHC